MLYYANKKEIVNNNNNNNNNNSPWPRNTGLASGGGHSHVLRADKALFSLGCQSSRDGASIKTPVVA